MRWSQGTARRCSGRVVALLILLGCAEFAGCRRGPAAPSNPPSNPPSESASPVRWVTQRASLEADDFRLEVNGTTFRGNAVPSRLHSDPGNATYCTLEVEWLEQGREMRMNIYFDSDRLSWWSNEIRSYNGKSPGNWVYYRGTFFRSPLGQGFQTGDLTLTSTPETAESARLSVKNLRVTAFK